MLAERVVQNFQNFCRSIGETCGFHALAFGIRDQAQGRRDSMLGVGARTIFSLVELGLVGGNVFFHPISKLKNIIQG